MSAILSEGTLFGGRYRVVRCIAAGGMGAVYEVIHTETSRRHALKVMHAHLFKSEEMRERFKREARITAEIQSEFIIYISDAGIDAATRTPFMVMELLRGEELGDLIEREGPLSFGDALIYLRQIASALDRTHAANIVHRDLKPSNLFLTRGDDGSPRIKILDFGVAKVVEDSIAAKGTQSLGTPMYMAPEQMRADVQLSGAADIYALGHVTFTLLVGRPYWTKELQHAGGLVAFIALAAQGPQVSAVARAAEYGIVLPPAFDAWFAKMSALHPAARFGSAGEAVKALEQVFAHWTGDRLSISAPLPPRPFVPTTLTTPTPDRVSRPSLPNAMMPLSPPTGPEPQTGGTIGALSSKGGLEKDHSTLWVGAGVALVVAAISAIGVVLGIRYSKASDSQAADTSSSAPASNTSPAPSQSNAPIVEPVASASAPAESSLASASSSPKRAETPPVSSPKTPAPAAEKTPPKKASSPAPASSKPGLFGAPLKF